jgi:ABC-2 type transport system permease protein
MSAATVQVESRPARSERKIEPIPLSRLVSVELRKMFDTRSGFWLMMSIAITAVIATGAVIIFASDDDLKYSNFAAAIGFPMAVILPIIAVLSVTSEWSQRSGLTTFTLVPHRDRVLWAKGIATVSVAVGSMLLAMAIGVVGNLLGATIKGVDVRWDSSISDLAYIILANVLGLLVGFMLGVLIRVSAAAIVGYFVYSFVLPTIASILAANAGWFEKAQPWVDFNYAQGQLFDGSLTGAEWAHLGVTGVIWLVVPLTVGVWLAMRSEVK